MTRSLRLLCAALAVVAGLAPFASRASAENDITTLGFRVLLGDRPIGTHHFRITQRGSARVVESRADFDVDVLFLNLYRYRHSATEIWDDACLTRIDSRTDDNGEPFEVSGRLDAAGLQIQRRGESELLAGCVRSFAYWDPRFLEASYLLNSQTGEYMGVRIESLGAQTLRLGEREHRAEAYRIRAETPRVDITVWYDRETREWLSLASTAPNGQELRYLPMTP